MLIFGKVWQKFAVDTQAMPMSVVRYCGKFIYICGV